MRKSDFKLLGDDESKDARAEELKAWDAIKLEGFSIAMEGVPVPEVVVEERTFGKGKSHDAEQELHEDEETPRMFAMENGRIVFKGEEN